MSLKFADLLKRALSDWPQRIVLKPLIIDGEGRHYIPQLAILAEQIADQYIASPEEILMRNLQTAIYEVIHQVEAYVSEIQIKSLRPESVRSRFERRINNERELESLGYNEADIELVRNYFSANRS